MIESPLVAVVGTVLGAFVAAAVYGVHFGDDTMRMAGGLTGTYSGGSVNFVSWAASWACRVPSSRA